MRSIVWGISCRDWVYFIRSYVHGDWIMEQMTFLGKWIVFGTFVVCLSVIAYCVYQWKTISEMIRGEEDKMRREKNEKN